MITSILHLDPPLQIKIVSPDEFVASNDGPADVLRKWSTTFPALKRDELAVVDPLLREVLGRELKPFEETVKEVLGVTGAEKADDEVQRYNK